MALRSGEMPRFSTSSFLAMGPSRTMTTLLATVRQQRMMSIMATTNSEDRSSLVYLERAWMSHWKNPPLSRRLIRPIRSMAKMAMSTRLGIPSTITPLTTKLSISTTSRRSRGSRPQTRERRMPKDPALIRATIR